MIFKNIEIYFLYASSKVRWAITFGILLLIFFCWWFFAFAPLRDKLLIGENKFKNACDSAQNVDQQAIIDSLNNKEIGQRISFVGDCNYFLKDLLSYQLETKSIVVEKSDKIAGHTATSIKIALQGKFENFYTFLCEHQKNYLCLWNSCICTKSPEGPLCVNAEILLYSK